MSSEEFTLGHDSGVLFLTLTSPDDTNCLTRKKVETLTQEIENMRSGEGPVLPLIISGQPTFSFGAELREIKALTAVDSYEFARMGQTLMQLIADFPVPIYAAIEGYCMGGGLDLALACHYRIACPNAVFGHRGAALGLMTGWGGTQRLPRLVGKARALEMLVTADKISALQAWKIGLVDAIAEDPVEEARILIAKREMLKP